MHRGALRRFLAGAFYLLRGFGVWSTSPRLMLLGAIPAVVVGAVFLAAFVVFALQLDTIAAWITPFAHGWPNAARIATRFAAGLALLAGVLLLSVSTFVAMTLAVGDPFYERIWRSVEERLGGAPAPIAEPVARALGRGIRTGLRIFLFSAGIGIALFTLGFVPVVGQLAVPVFAALFGGWVLAVEITGFAFDARGLSLTSRKRMLGADRATTLGFGVVTYLLFLVPFAAVAVMPAAVAGATLLARAVLAATPEVEVSR